MTATAVDVIEIVTGAGIALTQAIPGYFFNDVQVRVWKISTVAGVTTETPLVLGVDFTISKALNDDKPRAYTGTITTTAAVTALQKIAVMVWPINEQTTDFSALPHNPADYEKQHDLAAIRDQSLLEILKRSPRLPLSSIGNQLLIEPPQAGRLLIARADLLGWENGPDASDISGAQAAASSAAQDAAAAQAAQAALNLPTLTSGDAGKALVVNAGETGYLAADVSLSVADTAALKASTLMPKNIYVYSRSGSDMFVKRDWSDWSALGAYDTTYEAIVARSTVDTTKAWVRAGYMNGGEAHSEWWGIQGNASTVTADMTAEVAKIQAMMNLLEMRTLTAGGMASRLGGIARLGPGSYYVNNKLRIPSHVALRGTRVFTTTLYFDPSYAAGNCIEMGPNSSGVGNADYVFNSRIEDLYINAGNTYRGYDKAVIYTQGAHQPSGLFNVWVWGVVSIGVHFDQGLGGPANFTLDHTEIEAGTTVPTVGDKIGFKSSGGGAMINMNTCTIQGGGSTFAVGVDMRKDHLFAASTHFENMTIGFNCAQNETVRLSNTIISTSGHSTVGTVIQRSLTNNNDLVAINTSSTSIAATGLKIINDVETGFLREDGVVPFYSSSESRSTQLTAKKTVLERQATVNILSGAITVTGSYHVVDTEAAAATDDLDTINGGVTGQELIIRPASTIRDVVITNAGNIATKSGASVTLNDSSKAIRLVYDATVGKWIEP